MSTLFQYSDKSVVFMYFYLFGLSANNAVLFDIDILHTNKNSCGSWYPFFFGAFFPYYTVNDQGGPMILKVIASLLSPTAFALGSVNFADYERAHVGLRWSNIWQTLSGVNFFVCLLMMLVDILLYCGIGLYLDKVFPNENGVRHPWNFILRKCFRRRKNTVGHSTCSSNVSIGNTSFPGNDDSEPALEAISLEMKQQELDGSWKKHNNFDARWPSSSYFRECFGFRMRYEKVWVCVPRMIFFFPELTVKEHLEVFTNLKGVKKTLERVVAEMIDEVVILDESTSDSMRLTWQLIKKN
ncbi:ABC transporter A family member 1-like [Actinidia eriantha]|uniref:ABC transporter A family member 1-like n=1 Tax=Actinidia eriantha TaxID=165200 RepID=UPI002590EF06|nr:ABC transporter A family member 1-like [Actinidia eriantha]XP_057505911.1 ABC transporter A family member 1-like [Actinidia eriantha]XP_057505912.1 ABC transporter A family member 1-like [Actinidia eriantha]